MPITDDAGAAAEQAAGAGPGAMSKKQGQQAANLLAAAAVPAKEAQQREAAPDDLFGGRPVPEVPFSGFENEDEELLFGPTDRPDDLMGNIATPGRPNPPRNLEQYLPALLEAARQPDAPPELHVFLRVLAYHVGQDYS